MTPSSQPSALREALIKSRTIIEHASTGGEWMESFLKETLVEIDAALGIPAAPGTLTDEDIKRQTVREVILEMQEEIDRLKRKRVEPRTLLPSDQELVEKLLVIELALTGDHGHLQADTPDTIAKARARLTALSAPEAQPGDGRARMTAQNMDDADWSKYAALIPTPRGEEALALLMKARNILRASDNWHDHPLLRDIDALLAGRDQG